MIGEGRPIHTYKAMFDIEGKRINNKESLDEVIVTFRIIKVAVRFSEKNMTRVLTESNTAAEKPFKPIWTVEGRQRGKSARKKNPVSEAGKQPCCDWLKKWHVAATSIQKFSKDETKSSLIPKVIREQSFM